MYKFLFLFLFTSAVNANDLTAKVISVHDGDTFTIDKKDIADRNYRIRIRGIDTPELGWRAKCLQERQLSEQAKDKTTSLILNKDVTLKSIGLDKYGRLLADVYLESTNIGNELISAKVAKKYDLTTGKPKWCEKN